MNPIADVSGQALAELVSLSGRGAVVTGGAQGLGKAIARRLAEAGADVLIGDLNVDLARTAAAQLDAKYSGTVTACHLDVADSPSVERVARQAVDDFGGIDIWVNNAGVFPSVPLVELSEEQWDRVFSINARGTFIGSREAMRHMIAGERSGVIVNVSSLAGLRGIATGLAAYVSSKHAVTGLTRQMAQECAPHRIRVLAVAPSFMVTEGNMALIRQNPQISDLSADAIPSMFASKLGRVGVADDVARAVLFCASDLSIFMTGTTLVVDAGDSA